MNTPGAVAVLAVSTCASGVVALACRWAGHHAPARWRHLLLSCAFWTAVCLPVVGMLPAPLLPTPGRVTVTHAITDWLPERTPAQAWMNPASWIVLIVLMGGAVAATGGWIRNLRRVRRFASASREVPSGYEHRDVRTLLSTAATVPMLVGFRRPVIVLPTTLASVSPDIVELVHAHERSHAHRRDNWRLAVEHLALALFWWCVPLRAIHGRLLAAREEICDAVALAGATPSQRLAYARVLLDILRQSGRGRFPSPNLTGAATLVGERLERIVHGERRPGGLQRACTVMPAMGAALMVLYAVGATSAVKDGVETLSNEYGMSLRFTALDAGDVPVDSGTFPRPGNYHLKVVGEPEADPSEQLSPGDYRVSFVRRNQTHDWKLSFEPIPAR